MKKIYLFTALGFLSSNLFAQYELSSFTSTGRGGATTFATDYQAIGINPANLGWQYKFDDKHFALGFNEVTFSAKSDALSSKEIRQIFTGNVSDFTYAEKELAATEFSNSGMALNIDLGSLGFAMYNEKFGGLGFRMNDRIQTFIKLGPQTSDMLFLGKTSSYFDKLITNVGDTINNSNYSGDGSDIASGFASAPSLISKVIEGTDISMSWVREYNLSYGRKILEKEDTFQLYAGAGVKYLQGMALLNVSSEGGNLSAFSSVTPLIPIDYGTAADLNPSTVSQNPKDFLPKPVGHGFGFDFGANAILFEKLKLGVAVTNIGSITWDGNVYTVQDTIVYDTESDGLNNYNVFEGVKDLAGTEGLFKWSGEESLTVALPTVIRAGASMELGEKFELGCDFIVPGNKVPGSYENVIIGLGGDFKPVKFIKLSAGFVTGGNYGTQIPLGFTFSPVKGGYEFGIASRDAVSFFKDNGSTLSLSVGFLRFRF